MADSNTPVDHHPGWPQPGRHLWTDWMPMSKTEQYRTCVHPSCTGYEKRKAPM